MIKTRVEVYDDNGLVEIYYIDTEEPTQEELLAQKEAELLSIYEEIQRLKS